MEKLPNSSKVELKVKHHPKCDQLKLSFFDFADDLFILSNTDKHSAKTIKDSLDAYGGLSGLTPNLKKKSKALISGVEECHF